MEGEIIKDGVNHKAVKKHTVAVDDLVPLDAKESTAKPSQLQLGYEPHMPRVPKLDLVDHMRSMMAVSLQATAAAPDAATAAGVEDKVEVVYIPECGQEKGQGVMQCRVKKNIACGALLFYPYGGVFLHVKDDVGRKAIEKGFSLKSCYIRGMLVKAKAVNAKRVWEEEYILYSAMSHKSLPLATIGPNDRVERRHIPPFWAVMLVGRDSKQMVNMAPYMEEYTVPQQIPKTHGLLPLGSNISVQLPFLSNRIDLAPGDLLALPFDGGHESVCCEGFPPILRMSEL